MLYIFPTPVSSGYGNEGGAQQDLPYFVHTLIVLVCLLVCLIVLLLFEGFFPYLGTYVGSTLGFESSTLGSASSTLGSESSTLGSASSTLGSESSTCVVNSLDDVGMGHYALEQAMATLHHVTEWGLTLLGLTHSYELGSF